jgi:hypothetical protein
VDAGFGFLTAGIADDLDIGRGEQVGRARDAGLGEDVDHAGGSDLTSAMICDIKLPTTPAGSA